tara:strand:- start:237 stop:404 length:168 start_codon:yes stop_codon:yes gene_type:complete
MKLGIYQNNTIQILKISKYWNEALIRYVQPVGKQQKNAFKIGLPFLKKMEKSLSK